MKRDEAQSERPCWGEEEEDEERKLGYEAGETTHWKLRHVKF